MFTCDVCFTILTSENSFNNHAKSHKNVEITESQENELFHNILTQPLATFNKVRDKFSIERHMKLICTNILGGHGSVL